MPHPITKGTFAEDVDFSLDQGLDLEPGITNHEFQFDGSSNENGGQGLHSYDNQFDDYDAGYSEYNIPSVSRPAPPLPQSLRDLREQNAARQPMNDSIVPSYRPNPTFRAAPSSPPTKSSGMFAAIKEAFAGFPEAYVEYCKDNAEECNKHTASFLKFMAPDDENTGMRQFFKVATDCVTQDVNRNLDKPESKQQEHKPAPMTTSFKAKQATSPKASSPVRERHRYEKRDGGFNIHALNQDLGVHEEDGLVDTWQKIGWLDDEGAPTDSNPCLVM